MIIYIFVLFYLVLCNKELQKINILEGGVIMKSTTLKPEMKVIKVDGCMNSSKAPTITRD